MLGWQIGGLFVIFDQLQICADKLWVVFCTFYRSWTKLDAGFYFSDERPIIQINRKCVGWWIDRRMVLLTLWAYQTKHTWLKWSLSKGLLHRQLVVSIPVLLAPFYHILGKINRNILLCVTSVFTFKMADQYGNHRCPTVFSLSSIWQNGGESLEIKTTSC